MARAVVEFCELDYSYLPSRCSIDRANKADREKSENERKKKITEIISKSEKIQLIFDGKNDTKEDFNASAILHSGQEDFTALSRDAYYRHPGAQDIYEDLLSTIKEYRLQQSILFIGSDTTNINSGKDTGVMVRLQEPDNYLVEMGDDDEDILINFVVMCRLQGSLCLVSGQVTHYRSDDSFPVR